jgi:hypothetical protein
MNRGDWGGGDFKDVMWRRRSDRAASPIGSARHRWLVHGGCMAAGRH